MIKLEKVSIHQGNFRLSDIDMSIPEMAYAMLMGDTGCGKTTLLEAICGLQPVSSGRIVLGEQEVTKLEPSARQIGFVPQDAALFPTMRVDEQIVFGLEVRKVIKPVRNERVGQLAELLGIGRILKRYPRGLSGGERQRVALARALSFRPRLLCLDEPLSALDESTRSKLSGLLRTIHREENVTVLHITHNSVEARELGTDYYRIQDGGVKSIDENQL